MDATRTAPPAAHAAITAAPQPARLAAHAGENLRARDCWALLQGGGVGRLALVAVDGAPDLYPVDFTVHDGCLYVRSGPGSKLAALAARPQVAFETDGLDDGCRWSVVVRGQAARLDRDDEIEASGILDLVSSSPTPKHDFVCITPNRLSGRRFRVFPATAPQGAEQITGSPRVR
ncbi:pyridoxamine 5'-phosphate oxidase family protein [Microbacterium aurantiacum]|uniref:pyridoxamine 5'-phosphate oxidase family protein n=2 Tax=Microbacterium aurantiacum TaxID=162393 RepID=UPI0006AD5D78|nr:pyridoxamine 5'-phosphate oxidase family protein [Microbacterium chocolatum]